MFRNKKVLVTGATGLIGTYIIKELLKQEAQVLAVVHDRPMLINDERINVLYADLTQDSDHIMQGVDYAIHAAGVAIGAGVRNPLEAMDVNANLGIKVMRAALAQNVKGFLLLSSVSAYPPRDYPVKEDEMWDGEPYPHFHGYGWMRRYLEKVAETVHKQGLNVAIVRPTAAYGRYDNFGSTHAHVIPMLIERALRKENPFVVWGTGGEVRDFLHASDIAKGGLMALEHATCDPINLGSGRSATISEIVDTILKITEHNPEIVYDFTKPTTIPYRMVDTTKAKKVLGFEAQVSLEEGLRDTIEWYKGEVVSQSLS